LKIKKWKEIFVKIGRMPMGGSDTVWGTISALVESIVGSAKESLQELA